MAVFRGLVRQGSKAFTIEAERFHIGLTLQPLRTMPWRLQVLQQAIDRYRRVAATHPENRPGRFAVERVEYLKAKMVKSEAQQGEHPEGRKSTYATAQTDDRLRGKNCGS